MELAGGVLIEEEKVQYKPGMKIAGGELMEEEKVQAWNGASRRGTIGRGEGTSLEWG
jgi:hypothetical protein